MLQLSEITRIGAFSRADTIEQCRADLDAVEKQLEEMEAPVGELEAEIEQIKATLERGARLKVSDPTDFIKQGGNVLVTDLEEILSMKMPRLETLRVESQNLQEPLQITKSNLLALLARKQKKSSIRKEREEHLRVNAKSPINLARWVSRTRVKPTIWKVIAMAQKREDQILNEICELYSLKIVSKKDLSQHYARKYSRYRFRLYRRGYYLIPDDQLKGRKINQTQNNDEITANEVSSA